MLLMYVPEAHAVSSRPHLRDDKCGHDLESSAYGTDMTPSVTGAFRYLKITMTLFEDI